MLKEEADKIFRCIEFGFTCSVLTGSLENLRIVREHLFEKLVAQSYSVNLVDLYKETLPAEIIGENPILFVWGLENLAPTHDKSYSIRTYIDREKHSGLGSIIFCETGSYNAHFNDNNAPFYMYAARSSVDPV